MLILGILLLAVSVGLVLYVKKRRFDRTNQAGVQIFDSFWHMLLTRFGDKLMLVFALAIFSAGLGAFLKGITGK